MASSKPKSFAHADWVIACSLIDSARMGASRLAPMPLPTSQAMWEPVDELPPLPIVQRIPWLSPREAIRSARRFRTSWSRDWIAATVSSSDAWARSRSGLMDDARSLGADPEAESLRELSGEPLVLAAGHVEREVPAPTGSQ